jgi:hypothetical protein
MDNVFYFHGETEPNDMPTLSEDRRFGNRQTSIMAEGRTLATATCGGRLSLRC